MGERTQLSVAVVQGGKELCRTSIHYQWGYGRVMLMDALHIAWSLSLRSWWWRTDDKAIGEDILSYAYGDENLSDSRTRFHETLSDMFSWSDNDDGYAELVVIIADHEVQGMELRLYDSDGTQCTMTEYVQRGNAGEFADAAFRRHYKALLLDIGIQVKEPKEV